MKVFSNLALIIRNTMLFCAMLNVVCFSAQAQQTRKVPTIGVLFPGFPATYSARSKAFLQALHELGYVEGQTVTIEWKSANDQVEKIAGLSTELVRLKVDVIVAAGTPANKALKDATSTIPIVMAAVGDPVGVDWSRVWHDRVETSLD